MQIAPEVDSDNPVLALAPGDLLPKIKLQVLDMFQALDVLSDPSNDHHFHDTDYLVMNGVNGVRVIMHQ
jgi:hypothetical protein